MNSTYRIGRFLDDAVALKRKFGELVEKRSPSTEQHLPEHERDGVILEAVAEAMRQAVQPCPGDRASSVKQKHATPVAQKEDITVVLDEFRPSAAFGDRVHSQNASRDVPEQLALRKDYLFNVSIGRSSQDRGTVATSPSRFLVAFHELSVAQTSRARYASVEFQLLNAPQFNSTVRHENVFRVSQMQYHAQFRAMQ